jgi:hypothetical protein
VCVCVCLCACAPLPPAASSLPFVWAAVAAAGLSTDATASKKPVGASAPPPTPLPALPQPGSAARRFFGARVSPVAGVGSSLLASGYLQGSTAPGKDTWSAKRRHLTNDFKQKAKLARRSQLGGSRR